MTSNTNFIIVLKWSRIRTVKRDMDKIELLKRKLGWVIIYVILIESYSFILFVYGQAIIQEKVELILGE